MTENAIQYGKLLQTPIYIFMPCPNSILLATVLSGLGNLGGFELFVSLVSSVHFNTLFVGQEVQDPFPCNGRITLAGLEWSIYPNDFTSFDTAANFIFVGRSIELFGKDTLVERPWLSNRAVYSIQGNQTDRDLIPVSKSII